MTTTEVLEKILLPNNDLSRIDDVQIKEEEKTVYVHLSYKLDFVECDGERYPIYDCRHERSWLFISL